jgi:hypothetical protein
VTLRRRKEALYTKGAITIRLQPGVQRADVMLAHEAGHAFSIVADPVRYFDCSSNISCQNRENRHVYSVEEAVNRQESYLKKAP